MCNVYQGGQTGQEGGRPEESPRDAEALSSLLLSSSLVSFCFIIALLNFVKDQANPMSHVINADKYRSEQAVRSH